MMKLIGALAALGVALGTAATAWTAEIHDAARSGNVDQLSRIVSDQPDAVAARDETGKTPLHLAAAEGHEPVAAFLLDQGADVNARTDNFDTPLHFAAHWGHTDTVNVLLSQGAEIDSPDALGITPLQAAIMGAREEIVERRPDTAAEWRRVVQHENVEIVELLIAEGADVNKANSQGMAALHLAAESGRAEITKQLLERGADVAARDSYGFTPLMVAAYYMAGELVERQGDWYKVVRHDNQEVAALLIEAGAEIDARTEDGASAVFFAAAEGQIDVVDLLVAEGADVESPMQNGMTPLHAAAAGARLLEFEVQGDEQKRSYVENTAVVETLLARGADPAARDQEGRTPLDLAEKTDSTTVLDLLRSQGGATE